MMTSRNNKKSDRVTYREVCGTVGLCGTLRDLALVSMESQPTRNSPNAFLIPNLTTRYGRVGQGRARRPARNGFLAGLILSKGECELGIA